jgi:hypothetical protein
MKQVKKVKQSTGDSKTNNFEQQLENLENLATTFRVGFSRPGKLTGVTRGHDSWSDLLWSAGTPHAGPGLPVRRCTIISPGRARQLGVPRCPGATTLCQVRFKLTLIVTLVSSGVRWSGDTCASENLAPSRGRTRQDSVWSAGIMIIIIIPRRLGLGGPVHVLGNHRCRAMIGHRARPLQGISQQGETEQW